MRGISLGHSGLIEIFLYNLRTKIDEYVFVNLQKKEKDISN